MSDNNTLFAHLVPRLTSQVEDVATDSLGYILNRSAQCMHVLNSLLQEGGFNIEPIVRVQTQVAYEDGSRPDMTGYDKDNVKRLLVEAKFWATLLEGQASDYSQLFDGSGPSALLFISPELRIPTLWAEVRRQMEKQCELETFDSSTGVQRAKVAGTDLHILLVSWRRLLDSMSASVVDDAVKSDIQQLRGLTQAEDAQAFLPIRSEEMSPSLARRVVWYNRLVDDVVNARGVQEGWMDTKGLQATSQRYGYGRYFHFSGVRSDFWFGINHDMWASNGDTPLWLSIGMYDIVEIQEAISRSLNVRVEGKWVPIFPKLGVEYPEVLDDVVSQLKVIAELLRPISQLIHDRLAGN